MIIIKIIDHNNLQDVDKCDGTFLINAKLILSMDNDILNYSIVSTPQHQKCFPVEKIDYSTYIGNSEKIGYLAYIDNQIAGQIRLSKHWNKYAYIDDIIVDKKFRRVGVGIALIEKAKEYAQQEKLAGVMLETQNNNVGACKIYKRCGFELSGFDRKLYQGINPETDEIALYWYWICTKREVKRK